MQRGVASQAGIARAVSESLEDGTLPPEARKRLGRRVGGIGSIRRQTTSTPVFRNNYHAAKNAIKAAMLGLPRKEDVFAAAREVSNPFYTPRPLHAAI